MLGFCGSLEEKKRRTTRIWSSTREKVEHLALEKLVDGLQAVVWEVPAGLEDYSKAVEEVHMPDEDWSVQVVEDCWHLLMIDETWVVL
jgi:hypothetical protein